MRVAHIFVHKATNAGDIYLKYALHAAFKEKFPGIVFEEVEMRKIYGRDDIDALNTFDFIVLGGGGVLLRDTFPNQESDWQWACSKERLAEIKRPLIVYAIGYNRFRTQEDFEPSIFREHINAVVEKSVFFSVRNSGSQRSLAEYLNPHLHEKVRLNYCPSILYPTHDKARRAGNKRIGLLFGGDRLDRRHQDLKKFTSTIRKIMQDLSARGCELFVVGHQDNDFWYNAEIEGLAFKTVNLTGKSPSDVASFYKSLDVIIGDRGHAQMIPFGLGCRIISVISHNKLKWFLDDIGMPECGVEENDPDLAAQSVGLALSNNPHYFEKRVAALERIAHLHTENMNAIHDRIMSAL